MTNHGIKLQKLVNRVKHKMRDSSSISFALVIPAGPKLALVARMIADGAVFNLPHPVIHHWCNDDTQVWFTWNQLIDVNSRSLRTNQLMCSKFCQSPIVNLKNTCKTPITNPLLMFSIFHFSLTSQFICCCFKIQIKLKLWIVEYTL